MPRFAARHADALYSLRQRCRYDEPVMRSHMLRCVYVVLRMICVLPSFCFLPFDACLIFFRQRLILLSDAAMLLIFAYRR